MSNMRTMAFQVPQEMFDEIKDYLNRHHMKQKDFVLGLIRAELDRDQQQTETEEQDITEDESEDIDEADDEEYEDFDDDEDIDESDDMTMGME